MKMPPGLLVYYRLKLVDKDGKVKYSKVISTNPSTKSFEMDIYPNPVSDRLKLSIKGMINGRLAIKIYDVYGQLMQGYEIVKNQIDYGYILNMENLPGGMYYLQITKTDGTKSISKILKK